MVPRKGSVWTGERAQQESSVESHIGTVPKQASHQRLSYNYSGILNSPFVRTSVISQCGTLKKTEDGNSVALTCKCCSLRCLLCRHVFPLTLL